MLNISLGLNFVMTFLTTFALCLVRIRPVILLCVMFLFCAGLPRWLFWQGHRHAWRPTGSNIQADAWRWSGDNDRRKATVYSVRLRHVCWLCYCSWICVVAEFGTWFLVRAEHHTRLQRVCQVRAPCGYDGASEQICGERVWGQRSQQTDPLAHRASDEETLFPTRPLQEVRSVVAAPRGYAVASEFLPSLAMSWRDKSYQSVYFQSVPSNWPVVFWLLLS